MDTARCYQLSDPTLNRQFHRPWREPSPAAPRPAAPPALAVPDANEEPGMATLLRWRDEWRQRRSKGARRSAGPRT